MQDFIFWNRTVRSGSGPQTGQGARQLIVPSVEPVGRLPYELAGLLPNRNHKNDLMALIDNLPENRLGDGAVVGVFAADPFLNCKQIAVHLTAKGYSRVSNLPPVAGYGPEFLTTMDDVQSGRVREQRTITQMRDMGLTICPAVADLESLDQALSWDPPFIWITPSFEMWQNGAIEPEQLLAHCRAVSTRTRVPLILMRGHSGITQKQAQDAGARGMLRD
jgi:hypothetical protein